MQLGNFCENTVFNEEYKFCKVSNCVWGKNEVCQKCAFYPENITLNIHTLQFRKNI